jgi:MFS family permease
MSRLGALAHRNFRHYFVGQTVSLIGGFAHHVALSWLAWRLTHSAAVLGVVGFASTAPALVISPLAGVLSDRLPRKPLLMAVLSGVLVQCLLITGLMALEFLGPATLVAIALLRGVLLALEIPVRHALIAELVDDRAVLPNAVALHASALNAARFVGPAVGGALIAAAGEVWCFVLNAATLSFALWQIGRIPTRASHGGARSGEPLGRQLQAGLRYAFEHRLIRMLLIALFAVGLTTGPYASLMPGAVAELYSARPELVGLFLSAAGMGALAAALILATRRSTRGVASMTVVASFSAAAGLLLFSLSSWVVLSILGMILVGFGNIAQAAGSSMLIQQHTEDAMRGRVMSIYTAMFVGAMPLGSLAFGLVAEHTGTARAMTCASLLCLAGAARHAKSVQRMKTAAAGPAGTAGPAGSTVSTAPKAD